jgi:hypothetical protein
VGSVLCVSACPFFHDLSALGVVLPLSMGVLEVSVRAADAPEGQVYVVHSMFMNKRFFKPWKDDVHNSQLC